MSEYEMARRIDALKESETTTREERQELERRLRNMKLGRLLDKGDEG